MSDQHTGMIRDSDIKFECRVLLAIIQSTDMDVNVKDSILLIIGNIARLENERLDKLKKSST